MAAVAEAEAVEEEAEVEAADAKNAIPAGGDVNKAILDVKIIWVWKKYELSCKFILFNCVKWILQKKYLAMMVLHINLASNVFHKP